MNAPHTARPTASALAARGPRKSEKSDRLGRHDPPLDTTAACERQPIPSIDKFGQRHSAAILCNWSPPAFGALGMGLTRAEKSRSELRDHAARRLQPGGCGDDG
jgi:hypothetical protein